MWPSKNENLSETESEDFKLYSVSDKNRLTTKENTNELDEYKRESRRRIRSLSGNSTSIRSCSIPPIPLCGTKRNGRSRRERFDRKYHRDLLKDISPNSSFVYDYRKDLFNHGLNSTYHTGSNFTHSDTISQCCHHPCMCLPQMCYISSCGHINPPTNYYSQLSKMIGYKCPIHKFNQKSNSYDEDDNYEDIIASLKAENQTLRLQKDVLNDRIETQNGKIQELEKEKSVKLEKLMCDQEVCPKSYLDETRRELMMEITRLRQEKHAISDKHESQMAKLESELCELKSTLLQRGTEINFLRLIIATIARDTGYTLSESEMQLIKGDSSSLKSLEIKRSINARVNEKPPLVPRPSPYESRKKNIPISHGQSSIQNYRSPQMRGRSASPMARTNSIENIEPKNRGTLAYSTMPRLHGQQALQKIHEKLKQHEFNSRYEYPSPLSSTSFKYDSHSPTEIKFTSTNRTRPLSANFPHSGNRVNLVSFGKNFFWLKRDKRSSSAPELANKNHIVHGSCNFDISPTRNNNASVFSPKSSKPKGLKKFFTLIKKNETSMQNLKPSEFTRGGFRATTGTRLGLNERRKLETDLPFTKWDSNLVAQWFSVIGLGTYINHCKRLIKSGEHLLNFTEAEIEKDLGIKNRMHRKKLKLALSKVNNDCDALTRSAHQMDYLFVAKWLDDIGLPQYKEAFIEARVDGAMLHHLTIEEMIGLGVTTKLHYCSIKRGIQILREQCFDPNSLKRRATEEKAEWTPEEICLWTSHRVMEWLRSIDLSEYTSNLRGSGIHGALIIYEPGFDCETLATLLSIHSSKTLLRRHITTHFNQLVGPYIIRQKRDYQINNQSILPSTKLVVNQGKFTLIKRKARYDVSSQDYVCPLINTEQILEKTLNENEKLKLNVSGLDDMESNV